VFNARFERYQPARHIRIVNVLGMEDDAISPGAVVFTRNGREWRLDTVLEQPDDNELFLMFADSTSGHDTYVPRNAGDYPPARISLRSASPDSFAIVDTSSGELLGTTPATFEVIPGAIQLKI